MNDKGALQLDVGIVVSNIGGNSSHDRSQFHGLFSLLGIDFGIYIGPSYNLFRKIGPSIGAGLLIGQNGFLVGKIGIHFNRTFGLAILIPIIPIYGAIGAGFLSTLPLPQEARAAAAIPLLLMPASFAYQEEFRKLCSYGREKMRRIQRVNLSTPSAWRHQSERHLMHNEIPHKKNSS
ncbi:MAG: hypothetical protein LUQ38_08410 [Methanotrichaceae archaeon]|nr:hypothetical protein [Methanotrichaceae archaeon]